MHKFYLTLLMAMLCLLPRVYLYAQTAPHPIARQIARQEAAFQSLPISPLLRAAQPSPDLRKQVDKILGRAAFLNLSNESAQQLLQNRPDLLRLQLPDASGNLRRLRLYQQPIHSDGFQLRTASGYQAQLPAGLHYWGVVEGEPGSLAAISVFENEIMGFAQWGTDAYTLGRLQDVTGGWHVFYPDAALRQTAPAFCGADGLRYQIGKSRPAPQRSSPNPDNCVRMYVEADYDIFQDKGSLSATTNYVSGLFNQVAILYANENIDLVVSEILVWDTADPYTGPDTGDYLDQFRDNLNGNFNGDLAHLIGYGGSGGIAYLDVLCYPFYSVAYSSVNSTYATVPAYSWTVQVVTHEIGHNLGSPHTHACAWNGNDTAIDDCGPEAGYSEGCDNAPTPNAGTIMSYCHLLGGVGIDFNLGFGPQPGDLIRDRVYNAACLSACSPAPLDDAGISSIDAPVGDVCGSSIFPEVALSNYGNSSLTSVDIFYRVDNEPEQIYSWQGNLSEGASTTVILPEINFLPGPHTFTAYTSQPNGNNDEDPSNDSSSADFNSLVPTTYYADLDGDGYGDPGSSLSACSQPAGYVLNAGDCDDTNNSVYPSAACDDGNPCTENDQYTSDCECQGTPADSDGDGVCDEDDICPGGDDLLDEDEDGIPDECRCEEQVDTFSTNPLTHTGPDSSTLLHRFEASAYELSFTISDLKARVIRPNQGILERVSVYYWDTDGVQHHYGTYDGDTIATVEAAIAGPVDSLLLSLSNGFEQGLPIPLDVELSLIDYCQLIASCADQDGDGICDDEDKCPELSNELIGQACDDGDPCTVEDLYGEDCQCAGFFADADGDGVCDAEDECPGGDDTMDENGNGTPDDCEECEAQAVHYFNTNPLYHSGPGASYAYAILPAGHYDISFQIEAIDASAANPPYIDKVEVLYLDGNGVTQYGGVYTGQQTNTADLFLPGEVTAILVLLSNDYSAFWKSGVLSVKFSAISSCVELRAGDRQTSAALPGRSTGFQLYPNPAAEQAILAFERAPEEALITVRDVLGATVASYRIAGEQHLRLPVSNWRRKGSSGCFFISVQQPGAPPQTKRLMITN